MKILSDKQYNELVDSIRKDSYAAAREEYEKVAKDVQADFDKRIEEHQEKVREIDEGKSTMTFFYDDDLKVTIKSAVNKEIAQTLVDEGYIRSDATEDEHAIQIAFILMANEVTEQIIADMDIGDE